MIIFINSAHRPVAQFSQTRFTRYSCLQMPPQQSRRLRTRNLSRLLLVGTVCVGVISLRFITSGGVARRHKVQNSTESITISGLDKYEGEEHYVQEIRLETAGQGEKGSMNEGLAGGADTISVGQSHEAGAQVVENQETFHGELNGSAYTGYSASGFPSFFTCIAKGSPQECADVQEEPGRRTQSRIIFHAVREGCTTLEFISMVRQTIAAHISNSSLYTTPYLRHTLIDFHDPPIPLIGTSAKHSRSVTAGEISEFATHVAIWRQVFSMTGKTNAIVLSSYLPMNNTLRRISSGLLEHMTNVLSGRGDKWDMVILRRSNPRTGSISWIDRERLPGFANYSASESVDTTAYFISPSGVNVLLALTSAYILSLPEFLRAVTKLNDRNGYPLFRLFQYFEDENHAESTLVGHVDSLVENEECRKPHRLAGRTVWSHQLPFYPPHHTLLEIPGEN